MLASYNKCQVTLCTIRENAIRLFILAAPASPGRLMDAAPFSSSDMSISLTQAEKIIEAAIAKARELGLPPVGVAVPVPPVISN